jgi:transcriptional regulator with XRE-family HTH domain
MVIICNMRTKRDPLSEPIEVTQFVGEVGSRIRLMRQARGLTQEELAARADLGRHTVIAIEGGSLRTRFADIARLLWALDDVALQTVLANAAMDPVYQEAARAKFPQSRRRKESTE